MKQSVNAGFPESSHFWLDLLLPPDLAKQIRIALIDLYQRRWSPRYAPAQSKTYLHSTDCRYHHRISLDKIFRIDMRAASIEKILGVVVGLIGSRAADTTSHPH
jgi:hypothetical protein